MSEGRIQEIRSNSSIVVSNWDNSVNPLSRALPHDLEVPLLNTVRMALTFTLCAGAIVQATGVWEPLPQPTGIRPPSAKGPLTSPHDGLRGLEPPQGVHRSPAGGTLATFVEFGEFRAKEIQLGDFLKKK
jgi:hypothetical protein